MFDMFSNLSHFYYSVFLFFSAHVANNTIQRQKWLQHLTRRITSQCIFLAMAIAGHLIFACRFEPWPGQAVCLRNKSGYRRSVWVTWQNTRGQPAMEYQSIQRVWMGEGGGGARISSHQFSAISQLSVKISAHFTATSLLCRSHISVIRLKKKLVIISFTNSQVAVKASLDPHFSFITYFQIHLNVV